MKQQSKRLQALEGRRQNKSEDGDAREKLLAKINLIRRRLDESGYVVQAPTPDELAQAVAHIRQMIQTDVRRYSPNWFTNK